MQYGEWNQGIRLWKAIDDLMISNDLGVQEEEGGRGKVVRLATLEPPPTTCSLTLYNSAEVTSLTGTIL
ncbi:unnamed protein product [Linum tenue]|uniref:Uncharacterized protein n=1 Tax=Linum tenue TaxID=586396 RepID=A0AAV0IHN3_9ROSI|nr:unnamed protein product [Linum tenue]